MSFVKESIHDQNFCKPEDLNYHSAERSYHLDQYMKAMKEASLCLKKMKYHASFKIKSNNSGDV